MAQAPPIPPSQTLVYRNGVTIAATCSAITSLLVGYPFDSVKASRPALTHQTRMQAYKYPSTISCIKSTLYHEGVAGFYRGVLPQLVTTTTLRAMSWNIYTAAKLKLGGLLPLSGLPSALVPSTLAGAGTGFVASLLAAPLEFIKVQRQLQHIDPAGAKRAEKNIFGWLRHVVRHKGVSGLYTGYRYHAPMDIFGTAAYFAIYESFKYYGPKNTDGSPRAWVSVGGGGLAGALSWIVVFPMDVVKSMVQKEGLNDSPRRTALLVAERFKEFGLAGFYRGLSMQLIRSVPVHSLNFYIYESVLSYCRKE
ncbi:hypothetical protein HDV03_005525 [Kappamyces sp. JEL0829]|nr:hypothetical protein HDV03_005525 [Kappamyces sp. JEL0829]